MFNDQLLAGRRILVTGGGTGLGKAMATKFLQLGAEVHICGRRKAVCDETATELMGEHGGRVDSEPIFNRAHADILSNCGYRTTPQSVADRFCGISDAEMLAAIEREW